MTRAVEGAAGVLGEEIAATGDETTPKVWRRVVPVLRGVALPCVLATGIGAAYSLCDSRGVCGRWTSTKGAKGPRLRTSIAEGPVRVKVLKLHR